LHGLCPLSKSKSTKGLTFAAAITSLEGQYLLHSLFLLIL
jgi:hypothetical protein